MGLWLGLGGLIVALAGGWYFFMRAETAKIPSGSGTHSDRSMRLGTFVDAGQVYAAGEKVALSQLRAAWGISFAWNSPVGPLKFSIARPFNARPGDSLQAFQFTLGNVF